MLKNFEDVIIFFKKNVEIFVLSIEKSFCEIK